MNKIFVVALSALFAIACNSNKDKAQEEFEKIVTKSLRFEISDNKVVAHFNDNGNIDYVFSFLYNDDREDIVEIWHRYSRAYSYYRGETVGWILGNKNDDLFAYPVKAPRFGIIEESGYSLTDPHYGCTVPKLLIGSQVLFAMECDSVAICKEYINNRKESLSEFEQDRAIKRHFMMKNKKVRKNSDW